MKRAIQSVALMVIVITALLIFDTNAKSQQTSLANEVFSRFNASMPGYGTDYYLSNYAVHDMALGWYATAAVLLGSEAKARLASDQLLSVARKESPNFPGWGLGFAYTPPRPAGSSVTTNPPGAVYGITTAIAVRGILDAYQLTNDDRYAVMAREALDYYRLRSFNSYSNKGWFYYSNQSYDRVDMAIYNVTAGLMGQYARAYALWNRPEDLDVAQRSYNYLWSRKVAAEGGWAWPYRSNQTRLNDPLHAAYMEIGLWEYKNNVAPETDLSGVTTYAKSHSLDMEIVPNQNLWAIGAKVYAHKLAGEASAAQRLIDNVLPKFERSDGGYNWKDGYEGEHVRHTAHLVAGLAK